MKWISGMAVAVLGLVGAAPSSAQDQPKKSAVETARELVFAQKPAEAIAMVDPIITKALQDEAKDDDAMCPAVAGAIFSQLLGQRNMTVTVSFENDWCEAMLVKGYALVELKQYDQAAEVLKRLVGHDKRNPNYLAEYGLALRMAGRPDAAMSAYQDAKRAADGLPDKDAKRKWRAVALRGIGYSYIEQKEWDKAVKAYRDSLKDDPDSQIAKSELEFIEKNRDN